MSNSVVPKLPTLSQAEAIRNGNKALRDYFYLSNVPFIKTVAVAYCRRNDIRNDLWEDLVNNVYLVFPQLKFASNVAFARSIKDTFPAVRFGSDFEYQQTRQTNVVTLTILDEPAIREHSHGGVVETVADYLEADTDVFAEVCELHEPATDWTDKIWEIVSAYLTPRQREAWYYFYHDASITAREVGAKMGVSINGAQALKTAGLQKLRKSKAEILQRLIDIGYPLPPKLLC